MLPPGLQNGQTAISLFPYGGEVDNAKYTGPTSGGSNYIKGEINNHSNWTTDDNVEFAIEPIDYTFTINCNFEPEIEVMQNFRGDPFYIKLPDNQVEKFELGFSVYYPFVNATNSNEIVPDVLPLIHEILCNNDFIVIDQERRIDYCFIT